MLLLLLLRPAPLLCARRGAVTQAVLLRDACLSEIYAYDVLERAAVA
jgi:hypothetical protein